MEIFFFALLFLKNYSLRKNINTKENLIPKEKYSKRDLITQ